VRVELRGGDVGVAEHLLQGAQVAAAGEEMGREGVAQRVRAHLVGEPGRGGVALDDLVEALAREPGPAPVHEQLRLPAVADQARPAALEVDRERAGRRGPDRDEPLLVALAARAQDARLEVDVPRLERDRLRRAQAARVHDLEQRAVAQRGRLGAGRLAEELGDLVAREHVRQAAALARRPELRGGVLGQRAGASEVAVEGAQARGLALQRRRGDGRAVVVPGGELGGEGGEVGVGDGERVEPAAAQPGAVLEQVGAIGLERVARQPPLELEVGEEVEQQVLERLRPGRRRRDGHSAEFVAAR
jgi:hypothetical protein